MSLTIDSGQRVALVGESGSGKSVTALSILRLIATPPGRIVKGQIRIDGIDILNLSEREMRSYRGNTVAMIFQDPNASLNPVITVGAQIAEVLTSRKGLSRPLARSRTVELLEQVEISDAARRANNYPHEFSGGMRQRVMIAMALAFEPKALIADEPTTALDVTIQAQILELIAKLVIERDMGLLMITHDLGVVAGLCTDVNVMYAGQIVERAGTRELFARASHPYTVGLLKSIPRLDDLGAKIKTELESIPGQPPSVPPGRAGCAFVPRCANAGPGCETTTPRLVQTGRDASHLAACWYPMSTETETETEVCDA